MTVCTDEVALGDLLKDGSASKPFPDKIADLLRLVSAGQMIPLHSCMVIGRTAVGTRFALLESAIPSVAFFPSLLAHPKSFSACLLPVACVVVTPTSLAPGLPPPTSSVKVVERLDDATSSTALAHVASLDDESDS
jgi:hypothetical protein